MFLAVRSPNFVFVQSQAVNAAVYPAVEDTNTKKEQEKKNSSLFVVVFSLSYHVNKTQWKITLISETFSLIISCEVQNQL